jgi:hypothetical protein
MSEHKILRDQPSPASSEGFVINEPATGKSYPIREATDEQLSKHLAEANQAHMEFTRQAMLLIGQSVNAAKASAIMAYELERRQKTIQVVTDLSQVQDLRRQ